MQAKFISTFPGLYTSNNIFTLPEGSNLRAENVVFTREDIIEPRHGIPIWSPLMIAFSGPGTTNPVQTTNTYFGSYPDGAFSPLPTFNISDDRSGNQVISAQPKDLYYWRTLTTETYVVAVESNVAGNFWFLEIKPQDYSNPTDFPKYVNILATDSGISSNGVATGSPSNISNSPFTFPRYLQNNNGLYVSNARNWGLIQQSSFPSTLMQTTVIPNSVINLPTFFSSGLTSKWFLSGYAVDIVLTIVETRVNGVEVEGAPSTPYTVKNLTGTAQGINLDCITPVADPTRYKLRVYRTKQYLLGGSSINDAGTITIIDGESAPTQYIQAVGDTPVSNSVSAINVDLLFNDDILLSTGLPFLYTSSNIEGIAGAHNPPPISHDSTNFHSHAVYADVLIPPTATVQLLSLETTTNPATSALDGNNFVYSGTTWTFQNRDYTAIYLAEASLIPVEVNPPSSLGDTTAPSATGMGFFNYALGYIAPGQGVTPSVRLMNFDVGDTPHLETANAASVVVGAGGNLTVTFSPSVSNPKRFPATGGYFYLSSVNSNNTVSLMRYESTSQTAFNVLVFNKVQAIAGDDITGSTLSEDVTVWFIPGVGQPTDLLVYLGEGSIHGYDPAPHPNTSVGAHPLPPYYSLMPSKDRLSYPIGTIASFAATATVTVSGFTYRYIPITVNSYGVSDRGFTERIDQTSKNIVAAVNALNSLSKKAVSDPFIAGKFQLISPLFSAINLSVSTNTIGAKFEPTLTTTPTVIQDPGNSRVKNGIMISKQGFPELVPNAYYLAPTTVGSSANRILKLAATQDDVYMFKEHEGVFRMAFEQGVPLPGETAPPMPGLPTITQIDGTLRPVAPEAVQVLDNVVYFLSDRGFHRIQTNLPQYISKSIEQQVKTALARTPSYDGIRSYADRVKNIYICYFPRVNVDGTGISFIFNARTELWSTSTEPFDWAVQDTLGRITSIASSFILHDSETDPTLPTTTDTINSSFITTTNNWTYLRQEQFTGQEVDSSGVVHNVLNIVDASIDQYDEKLDKKDKDSAIPPAQAFSTSVYSSGVITLTRTKANYPENVNSYFGFLINRMKNKQLYYKTTVNEVSNTHLAVTISSYTENGTTSTIVLTPTDSVTSITTSATNDSLIVGVNTILDFVPLHGGNPEILKQFARYGTHYQQRSEPDSLPSRLTFAFAVDNQAAFSTPIPFTTVVAERTIYETIVPLVAARGRFLKVQVKHNVPEEYFLLNGLAFSIRETNAERVTLK